MSNDYDSYVNEEVRGMDSPTDHDEYVMNEEDCFEEPETQDDE